MTRRSSAPVSNRLLRYDVLSLRENNDKLEKENKLLRKAFIEAMDHIDKWYYPPTRLYKLCDRIKNDTKSNSP